MVDSAKRQALLQAVKLQPEWEAGSALVKVAEFFDGNDDLGSIGCNLSDHPGLQHFRSVLESIAGRDDVDEVWTQIYDLEEGDWPFSENVLVVGEIPESAVRQYCESLQPSDVCEMRVDWIPSRAGQLAGRRYVNLWWD
jgi:hypothetical protein